MNKEQRIIKFYLYINKLKYKIRTGWKEVNIKKDRLESVAEHIYGCLMLAVAIDCEYELKLDMYKVLKMLTIHELDEVTKPDFTLRFNITKEEKNKIGKESVDVVANCLFNGDDLKEIVNEFNEGKTREAKFCYLIDKIECDMQAKVYDLDKAFDEEKAKEDLLYFGDMASFIEKEAKCASDYWILFDKPKFEDDKIFKSIYDELLKTKSDKID